MFSPSHNALANVSVPNLQEYADRHGYQWMVIMVENDKWEYKKHEQFERYFNEFKDLELIWYKDVDTIITDMTKPITDFIDDHYSFYLTKDANEFNGGSVIIKNTAVGRAFNKTVLENRNMFQNEQNVYNSMPMLMFGIDIMKPIPHPSINSYDYSLYKEHPEYVGREDLGDWAEGHLLLHVPGLPMEKRIEVLSNAKIIR